jgi:hypothetical protein
MTHHEIAEWELVESYSQGKLSDADSQAFEEHFFTCDECFAEVQAAGNFIAGVRQAAATGRLSEAPRSRPAFAFAWAAAAVLMVTTVWAGFFQLPKGRRELERQRAAYEAERGWNREIENQLAMVHPPSAEGNLPLAMLEASRGGQTNEMTVPPGASQLIFWIELDPATDSQVIDSRSVTRRESDWKPSTA